ncbi:sensor histidine kinase [Neobacillus ginsengisoli]|uniref:Two-component system LytT family sensor kinase n=1 Tax=Neobacillus ginsengisoli TaxID=904295 RepID=A0ABT9Y1G4_9BACI|nr:sensor histidine kinase [Neobacillus ginsengisoli]MDQ0201579.1 two-component system LytT family sensor kinase [Neobacillus ginsengisoli]
MYTSLEMLIHLFERAALLLICLFFMTRIPRFKESLQKDRHSPAERVVITFIFCVFAIFGTYSGIKVEGSIMNIRTIAIVSGGILFGPWVGVITGIVSGVHRYFYDIGGVTSVPCLITSIVAGIVSGFINRKVKRSQRWIYGIAAGMFCEVLTMLLILRMANPFDLGLDIVSKIGFPMVIGEINIGLIVLLVMSVEGEKEMIAAKQAKLALEIANKTLPYFRSINSESLKTICTIIKDDIKADAVAITDTHNVLAYVGFGEERYKIGQEIISDFTKEAIRTGKITIKNQVADHHTPQIQYLLIMPFEERGEVTGTLKIYYRKAYKMTYSLQTMAIGLSQMISTLMEVSRIEQIKEAANKAELKALQTKINPHFLFNALNAIASTTRRNPEKARELIINLSGYMRYNLEVNDELIDIHKALEQVRDYVEIEKARFGSRLKVEYDIDEVSVSIPSLLIQPLVENAIIHGILKTKGPGIVTIAVKDMENTIRISVKDTGAGIEEEVIENLYRDNVPARKIGLYNVHQRVKLIYGKGLIIHRLAPGTEVYFDIAKEIK